MPVFREIRESGNCIAVWQVDESEEALLRGLGLGQSPNLPTNPRRRLERLAAISLIRHLGLGSHYGYQPNGSPYLPGSSMHISVSHAGNKVVVAANPDSPVGVDIERTERNYRRVAPRFISQGEAGQAQSLADGELSLVWCVKEAVYKLPWGASKCFSAEIDVLLDGDTLRKGWCAARVKHNGEWCTLRANFEYFDNYCLAWVNL